MKVDLKEVRYFERLPIESDGYWIEENDLLFTRYNGSVDLLGVSGMVRNCTEPTLHPDKLIRVKTVLGTPLPSFIEIASNVGFSRRHMESRTRTTAGQTGISGKDIREIPLPLPSSDEQKQILSEVGQRLSIVDAIEAQVEANLKRAARLRQGILKRAFEGRLVPQDPDDEPAARLLERLREEQQPPDLDDLEADPPPRKRRAKRQNSLPLFKDEGDA